MPLCGSNRIQGIFGADPDLKTLASTDPDLAPAPQHCLLEHFFILFLCNLCSTYVSNEASIPPSLCFQNESSKRKTSKGTEGKFPNICQLSSVGCGLPFNWSNICSLHKITQICRHTVFEKGKLLFV